MGTLILMLALFYERYVGAPVLWQYVTGAALLVYEPPTTFWWMIVTATLTGAWIVTLLVKTRQSFGRT